MPAFGPSPYPSHCERTLEALNANKYSLFPTKILTIFFIVFFIQCGQQRREVVLRGPVEPVLPRPAPLPAVPGRAVELPRLRHPRQARQTLHGARHQPPEDGPVSEAIEPKWIDL